MAVSIGPELLADALLRVLAERGLGDVPVSDVERVALSLVRVEVALVSKEQLRGRAPQQLPAPVVVCLPEHAFSEAATKVVVFGRSGRHVVEVGSLEDLVDLIAELARRP